MVGVTFADTAPTPVIPLRERQLRGDRASAPLPPALSPDGSPTAGADATNAAPRAPPTAHAQDILQMLRSQRMAATGARAITGGGGGALACCGRPPATHQRRGNHAGGHARTPRQHIGPGSEGRGEPPALCTGLDPDHAALLARGSFMLLRRPGLSRRDPRQRFFWFNFESELLFWGKGEVKRGARGRVDAVQVGKPKQGRVVAVLAGTGVDHSEGREGARQRFAEQEKTFRVETLAHGTLTIRAETSTVSPENFRPGLWHQLSSCRPSVAPRPPAYVSACLSACLMLGGQVLDRGLGGDAQGLRAPCGVHLLGGESHRPGGRGL
jgi:hypothetical protein